jgi:hypothetical protein
MIGFQFSDIKVLVDAAVHSEHDGLIRSDIWPRLVERSGND